MKTRAVLPSLLVAVALVHLLAACTSEPTAEPTPMPTPPPADGPTSQAAPMATPVPVAEDRFNSVRASAAPLEVWQPVYKDETDYQGDTDSFRFQAEAGQTYRIDIYPFSYPDQAQSSRSRLTLYDSSGMELASFDRSMDWEVPKSGFFYLAVATTRTDSYELLIIPPCAVGGTGQDAPIENFWSATGLAQVQRLFMDCFGHVDTQADYGAGLLVSAVAFSENPAVTRALLDAVINPETKSHIEVGLLHVAASYNGNPEVIKVLLDAGADVNAKTSSGHTPLHSAAGSSEDNWKVIRVLLDAGADVNAWTDRGITPLHSASRSDGHPAEINVLLDAGADVNAGDNRGITPLHVSASTGNLEVVKALLEGGADVNAKTSRVAFVAIGSGATPLHYAVVHPENQAVIQVLLDADADIEARNSDGETPLDLAMKRGNSYSIQARRDSDASQGNGVVLCPTGTEVWEWADEDFWRNANLAQVQHELLCGADVEAGDGSRTPLHLAAGLSNDPAVLQALLDAGANVNAGESAGSTPLHSAAAGNDPAMLQALLEAGANVNARDSRDGTPLHAAASFSDNPTVLQALLEAGAGIQARDIDGRTPLHTVAIFNYNPERARDLEDEYGEPPRTAAYYENPAVLQALLDAGADVEVKDDFGWTPLHAATVYNSNPAVITALLDAGANPKVKNNDGTTPLHYAAGLGNPVIVQILLDAGAEVNARNDYGETPLTQAIRYDGQSVVQLLQENGARE